MSAVLLVLGIIALIADVVATISAIAGGTGFFVSLLSGALGLAGGFSLIALGMLKDQLDVANEKLDRLTRHVELQAEKVTCVKCGKEYEGDYSSCPYCGSRH